MLIRRWLSLLKSFLRWFKSSCKSWSCGQFSSTAVACTITKASSLVCLWSHGGARDTLISGAGRRGGACSAGTRSTRATGAAAWVVRGGESAAAPAGSRTSGGSSTAEPAGIIEECGVVSSEAAADAAGRPGEVGGPPDEAPGAAPSLLGVLLGNPDDIQNALHMTSKRLGKRFERKKVQIRKNSNLFPVEPFS